ncbi:MAG: acyltransferase, partial [Pseudomonadota bacterium]|nr:acyltransferase [Pseudomonadota bacterium]
MSAAWKQRPEAGGRIALGFIRGVARYGGRGLARALLYPGTLYFLLRRAPERAASRAWLGRVFSRPATFLQVARHHHTFAATILDRLFLLSGQLKRFDVRVQGLDALNDALAGGRGVLLFGSHLGSFEVLRVLSRERPEVKVRVVLDIGHNPIASQMLDTLNPAIAATVIDAGQSGPTIMLQIQQAIEEGAIVTLLADRVQSGQAWLPVPFLGRDAPLPVAPWLIASVLAVPVMLAFGLYRGGKRYELVFEPFEMGSRVPRAERAARLLALVGRYAARLEHHARQAPYNWFNFYDFWELPDGHADTPARTHAQQDPAPAAIALACNAVDGPVHG